jgi:DNA-directed RNA polymerase specialized sigma24 family protein
MSHQTDLRLLALNVVADRCARETRLFFQGQVCDPRYCFELFRRAIVGRNQRAWEFVYNQYRPLVTGWVSRHPAFPASGEETQYFVNRAFEKMWVALTPEKFDRFSNLKSLLRYLQTCVHSVILDQVRVNQVRVTEQPVVDVQTKVSSDEDRTREPFVEHQALDRMCAQELWEEINARLSNEKERLVIYGSFFLALKPRELYAQFQDKFCNVNEVYRVKENVLARLRRDAELKNLFGQDA